MCVGGLQEEGQEEEQTEAELAEAEAERRQRVCVKEEGVTRAAVAAAVAQYEEAVRVELGLLSGIASQPEMSRQERERAAAQRQRAEEKERTPLLGRRVVICGLVAKPELNGRTGTAVSFDDDKGRYSVELDETCASLMISASLMMKPCNLFRTVCSVALCSVFSQMQTLRCLFYCRLAQSTPTRCKRSGKVLEEGGCVHLRGLGAMSILEGSQQEQAMQGLRGRRSRSRSRSRSRRCNRCNTCNTCLLPRRSSSGWRRSGRRQTYQRRRTRL
jgi:hypothetical protein